MDNTRMLHQALTFAEFMKIPKDIQDKLENYWGHYFDKAKELNDIYQDENEHLKRKAFELECELENVRKNQFEQQVKDETQIVSLMVINNLLSSKVENCNAQLIEKKQRSQRLSNLLILEKQEELRKIKSQNNTLKLKLAKIDTRKRENKSLKEKLANTEEALKIMRSRKNTKRKALIVAENQIFDITKQNNSMKHAIVELEQARFKDRNRIHNLILHNMDEQIK